MTHWSEMRDPPQNHLSSMKSAAIQGYWWGLASSPPTILPAGPGSPQSPGSNARVFITIVKLGIVIKCILQAISICVNNWLTEYELLVRSRMEANKHYRQNSLFPSCSRDISPGRGPGPGSSSGEPPGASQSDHPRERRWDTWSHIYSSRCRSDWKLAENKPGMEISFELNWRNILLQPAQGRERRGWRTSSLSLS